MPLSQPTLPHKTSHENTGSDEIDATGLTGAGGGGGGWVTESTDATKLDTGRTRIWDENVDGSIVLDGSIHLLAGAGFGIELELDPGEVVDISSGDGLLLPPLAGDPTAVRDGQIYYNTATDLVRARANGAWTDLGSGGGAPTTADYLVGTAQGGLSAEIVVGATPGGELGGTWGTPTVDATHSGSTHSAATDTHIADATDAHDASAVSFDDTGLTITAADVQTMGEQLDAAISAGGIPSTIVDAKGDSIVGTAADTVAREAVGADGTVLVAASGEATGRKWAARELDYVEKTSATSVTATSEATANTVVTGSAITYDGATAILIDFYAEYFEIVASTNARLYLYDGASSIGILAVFTPSTSLNRMPVHVSRRLTPSAAEHTYSIRAATDSGTASVNAGAGGSGNAMPAFIRITRAL